MRQRYSFINMSVGLGGQFLSVVLAFFSRIVFIHYLSSEHLGINGVFTNVLSILSLAELGIGTAMIYSLYKPAAEDDRDTICRLMNLYRRLYRCVAAVVLVLGLMLLPFLDYLIKGNSEVEHLRLIYMMYLMNSVISYLLSYKNSILLAYQKAYYRIAWEHIMHILQIVLQILVLVLTQNFILYLLIQMLNQISVNVIVARKVDRDYPYLKECKELPDKETCASISKNILAMSMHRIGGAVVNGTDNLIMSAFVGLSSAGIYSNYQLVFSNVNLLLHKIYNAFGTSIGNLAATENTGKIYGIYKQLDFFMFALYGYLSVGIFVMINPLIELLFGKEYLFSIPLVFVMTANFYITGMRQINLQFRSAMGLFWHDRYRPLFEAVINLVVSIVLVQTYGVLGILTGTIVSTLTTCFWTEPYVLMRYGMKDDWKHKLKSYFTTYAVRTGSVVLAGAVSYQICRLIGGTNPGWFLIKCGICTIIYWAVFWCGYSRCEEYVYLKERVGAVVEKVRRKWK